MYNALVYEKYCRLSAASVIKILTIKTILLETTASVGLVSATTD
jgi:hypothetical protein